MTRRAGLGLAAGILLMLSSVGHTTAWPPFKATLEEAGIDAETTGAIAVGWYFGSVAILTFGVLTLLAVRRLVRGVRGAVAPVRIIATAYLAYGLTAFVVRDFKPFFLVFVATGVLLAGFSFPRER